ncbi:MAG: 50S ribosomal protein L25 [Patescibacteria group bacterium]
MTEFKITAEARSEKPAKTRATGKIPAIVYGKHFESASIALDKINFLKLFKEAGTSNLIEMSLDDKKFKTLVHDMQYHPITREILHIDFVKVNMKEKVHAEIPLEFTGDSIAVIDMEGSLITPVDSIEVECLPGDLISEISVDISVLDNFEKNIKISDLNIPESVEVLNDPEEIVAFVQEPRSEEEMEALNEEVVENIDAVEVENKGEEATAEGEGEKTEEKKSE